MKAYKVEKYIIAADMIEDVREMFKHEIGGYYPDRIEELGLQDEIELDDGRILTVKEIINETMDERQAWRRMGIPCELYRPFLIKEVKE
jgi:hypothetical protein